MLSQHYVPERLKSVVQGPGWVGDKFRNVAQAFSCENSSPVLSLAWHSTWRQAVSVHVHFSWSGALSSQDGLPWLSPCSEVTRASLVAQVVKNLSAMQETWVRSLSQEDPLEKGMDAHSNILSWRIPWTEEPRRLQSMESQRVGEAWMLTLLLLSLSGKLLAYSVPWFHL